MKKSKIKQKLLKHSKSKNYVRITREMGGIQEISTGFILALSSDFIVLQESDEFRILNYLVIPTHIISHVRYNKNDKKYEDIIKQEGLLKQVKLKYKMDLSSWKSVCKSIQATGLPVISECEHPDLDFFCIGQIKKVKKSSIEIQYFNAQGILDKKNTKHYYEDITKLSFDDRYANIFSKYLKKK